METERREGNIGLLVDLDARVERRRDESELLKGSYGGKGRNSKGKILADFLMRNNLKVMNSFSQQKIFYRYTGYRWENNRKCIIKITDELKLCKL